MINMSGLHNHSDYEDTLEAFNSSPKTNGVWSIFKDVHLKVAKNRCPICECPLDDSVVRNSNRGQVTLKATIDHYRPKDDSLYPNLKYDHENYLLMCSDCNNAYKGNKFPLHSSTPNSDIVADKTSDILTEKPLIVNPIYDNIYNLFKIVLKNTSSGKKILELNPKNTSGYEKEKAEETIKVFSLGNCEDISHSHENSNVQNCRINLLHHHYIKFRKIVSILNGKKLLELSKEKQKEVFVESQQLKLNEYGFLKAILNANYIDLT